MQKKNYVGTGLVPTHLKKQNHVGVGVPDDPVCPKHPKQRGITLIALIITIIIMLILAGVTISIVINGGLFGQAEEAVRLTDVESTKEQIQMDVTAKILEKRESELLPEHIKDILDEYVKEGYTYNEEEIINEENREIVFPSDLKTKKGNSFNLENMSIITVASGDSGNNGGNTTTPDIPEVDEQEVVPRRRLYIKCRSNRNSMVRHRK